jgi:hypothetical protein
MTKLQWDRNGDRVYEAGLSRGVLYLDDGEAVAWNGIVSVAEKPEGAVATPFYFNGAKRLDYTTPADYASTILVYTYPDEFMDYDGYQSLGGGLYAKNQMPKRFGLSYRTEVGNDLEGFDYGYKLHIVYNLAASANSTTFSSRGGSSGPINFGWDLSATPEPIDGYRSTAHVIIDSRRINGYLLDAIENILYGSNDDAPRLPRLAELKTLVGSFEFITLTDNGDGTFTISGPEEYFNMIDSENFEVTQVEGFFISDTEYTISTTGA